MHYSELTKQIVAYINHNYAKAISLDDIAESVGLNKNYICNAFKKDTGITIINCLTAVRIRKAAEMISYGECTLAQVAQQTGFINTSHFNRIFTKYTGISPGQYRRAYPVDILLDSVESHFSELDMDPEASRFIYSVLAHKKLTMEELRTKDIEDAKNEK
jgi:AraC-like DNA-binding protein